MTTCRYNCKTHCRMGFAKHECPAIEKPRAIQPKPQPCGTCGQKQTAEEPYLPPGRITKWLGVLWLGTPAPKAWYEYWMECTWPDRACGCTIVGKTWWNSLKHCVLTLKQARQSIRAVRDSYNQSAAQDARLSVKGLTDGN